MIIMIINMNYHDIMNFKYKNDIFTKKWQCLEKLLYDHRYMSNVSIFLNISNDLKLNSEIIFIDEYKRFCNTKKVYNATDIRCCILYNCHFGLISIAS